MTTATVTLADLVAVTAGRAQHVIEEVDVHQRSGAERVSPPIPCQRAQEKA